VIKVLAWFWRAEKSNLTMVCSAIAGLWARSSSDAANEEAAMPNRLKRSWGRAPLLHRLGPEWTKCVHSALYYHYQLFSILDYDIASSIFKDFIDNSKHDEHELLWFYASVG